MGIARKSADIHDKTEVSVEGEQDRGARPLAPPEQMCFASEGYEVFIYDQG